MIARTYTMARMVVMRTTFFWAAPEVLRLEDRVMPPPNMSDRTAALALVEQDEHDAQDAGDHNDHLQNELQDLHVKPQFGSR